MANIKDVAKLAGVSVTTVSRVLNNKGYISQDVRILSLEGLSTVSAEALWASTLVLGSGGGRR